MDIRRAGLVAFAGAALALPLPMWSSLRTIWRAVETIRGLPEVPFSVWLMMPLLGLGLAQAAITPAFYFALHRNGRGLRIPREFGPLCLGTAVVTTLNWARTLLGWASSRGRSSVFDHAPAFWDLGRIGGLLNLGFELTYILVLVALYRSARHDGELDAQVFLPFRFVCKVTVIVLGICLAITTLQVFVGGPIAYYQVAALHRPEKLPISLMASMVGSLFHWLDQACLFLAPLVVYRSCSKRSTAVLPLVP